MKLSLKIFLVIVGFEACFGYRILGLFPLNVRSHVTIGEHLMRGLARRGHHVDVVSAFPNQVPVENYTDITVPHTLKEMTNDLSYEKVMKFSAYDQVKIYIENMGNDVCQTVLNSSQIQKLINNPPQDPPYDLIIMEIFTAQCFVAFAHHLNIPIVGVIASISWPWTHDLTGDLEHLAILPNNLLYNEFDKTNFFHRLINFFHSIYCKAVVKFYQPRQNEMVKKYFGRNTPGLDELEKSFALVLANSHPSLSGALPKTPSLIEVGGIHVNDDGPDIPTADKKWLDDCKDGFILFTFGSMITIESFPLHVLQAFYNAFEKIHPVKVFMKAPEPKLLPPGLPKNVRLFSWTPQVKVLKHKNIRAFITHAGLMGSHEAISAWVPMIAIPVFADQYVTMKLLVERGIAIRLNHQDITEEKLDFALNKALYNLTFRKIVKEFSNKYLDRPMSAMDTANYWIEYIARHGSKALRSPSLDLTWWQSELLDVYAVILLAILLFCSTNILIIKHLIKRFYSKRN